MSEDIGDFILPVLFSGYVGEGPKCAEFEKKFGEYIQNPNVVLVNSGTSAITMALRLAGVGSGDYVITTPMTCLATNMAILSLGAIPVWADILLDGTICPDDVLFKISMRYKKPKAIVCVDWGGIPCILDDLKGYGIPIIEDACQSIGSFYKGKPVESDADFVCFSFQAIKYLTLVDGGMIAINGHDDLLEQARLMRWFGLDRTKCASVRCDQDPPFWGYKFQSNDVLASIGLANLRYIDQIVQGSKNHAKIYNQELSSLKNVQIMLELSDRDSAYWFYTIFVKDVSDFVKFMYARGIECSKAHTRNDNKLPFKGFETPLPGVDYFEEHHVCIPVGWWLKEEDVAMIVNAIKEYDRKDIHGSNSLHTSTERGILRPNH